MLVELYLLMTLWLLFKNPVMAAITMVLISLIMIILAKSINLSLILYLIMIIFVSGVLLLIFYICVMSSHNANKWKKSSISMLIGVVIFMKKNSLNLTNQPTVSSLENSVQDKALILLSGLILLLVALKVLNNIMSGMKYFRQI